MRGPSRGVGYEGWGSPRGPFDTPSIAPLEGEQRIKALSTPASPVRMDAHLPPWTLRCAVRAMRTQSHLSYPLPCLLSSILFCLLFLPISALPSPYFLFLTRAIEMVGGPLRVLGDTSEVRPHAPRRRRVIVGTSTPTLLLYRFCPLPPRRFS